MEGPFLYGQDLGLKIEIVDGLPIWEAQPLWRHQSAVDRIRASIEPREGHEACGCVHAADVYVRFDAQSVKRPDVAIFCREPDDIDAAITMIPEAVVEVISRGYEKKDLLLGLDFYLARGVKDVVVLDPRSGLVIHARREGSQNGQSPHRIDLECGCTIVV